MKRKDRILNYIIEAEKCGKFELITEEIAKDLNLQRSAVSLELNKLFIEKKLVKHGKKPVIYKLNPIYKNTLSESRLKLFNELFGVSNEDKKQIDLLLFALHNKLDLIVEGNLIHRRGLVYAINTYGLSEGIFSNNYEIIDGTHFSEFSKRNKTKLITLIKQLNNSSKNSFVFIDNFDQINSKYLSYLEELNGHLRIIGVEIFAAINPVAEYLNEINIRILISKHSTKIQQNEYLYKKNIVELANGFEQTPNTTNVSETKAFYIIAYGDYVATEITNTLKNNLLFNNIFPVNAGIIEKSSEIFEKLMKSLKNNIKTNNLVKEVYIFSEVDVFLSVQEDLSRLIGIEIRIFSSLPSVNLSHILQKIITTSDSVNEISNWISEYIINKNKKNSKRQDIVTYLEDDKKIIISYCPGSILCSLKIRDLLFEYFSSSENFEIVLINDYDELISSIQKLGKNIVTIVGSEDPYISDIPFINMDILAYRDGSNKIKQLLLNETNLIREFRPSQRAIDSLNLIANQIGKLSPSLDGDSTFLAAKNILELLEDNYYKRQLDAENRFRIVIHLVSMFERLAQGKKLSFSAWVDELLISRSYEYELLRSYVIQASKPLDLEVTTAELCYFLKNLPLRG